jgi:hypothetical protein
MIPTLILVLIAGLALIFFLVRIRGFRLTPIESSKLADHLLAVDLDAFRNLVDPDEEQYLREHLPPAEFRSIQRQRLRAALDYVAGVSHNAEILLHFGQAARLSPDPRVAEAARQLVDDAVRLRLYALVAAAKLCARIAFPGNVLGPVGIVDSYQSVSHRAALLGRLQNPAKVPLASKAS